DRVGHDGTVRDDRRGDRFAADEAAPDLAAVLGTQAHEPAVAARDDDAIAAGTRSRRQRQVEPHLPEAAPVRRIERGHAPVAARGVNALAVAGRRQREAQELRAATDVRRPGPLDRQRRLELLERLRLQRLVLLVPEDAAAPEHEGRGRQGEQRAAGLAFSRHSPSSGTGSFDGGGVPAGSSVPAGSAASPPSTAPPASSAALPASPAGGRSLSFMRTSAASTVRAWGFSASARRYASRASSTRPMAA